MKNIKYNIRKKNEIQKNKDNDVKFDIRNLTLYNVLK